MTERTTIFPHLLTSTTVPTCACTIATIFTAGACTTANTITAPGFFLIQPSKHYRSNQCSSFFSYLPCLLLILFLHLLPLPCTPISLYFDPLLFFLLLHYLHIIFFLFPHTPQHNLLLACLPLFLLLYFLFPSLLNPLPPCLLILLT